MARVRVWKWLFVIWELFFCTVSAEVDKMDRINVFVEEGIDVELCPKIVLELEESIRSALLEVRRWTNLTFPVVSVSLPPSWNTANCIGDKKTTSDSSQQDTDFLVEKKSFLKNVWAEQFGQCGSKGKTVHIPLEFLASRIDGKGYLLAKEYIKFRYGVFEDFGFENDSQYPGVVTDGQLGTMDSSTSGESFYNQDQDIVEKNRSTTTVHKIKGAFVEQTAVYNREALTKQNILCNERSALEVVKGYLVTSPNRSPIEDLKLSSDEDEKEQRIKRELDESSTNGEDEDVQEEQKVENSSGVEFYYSFRRKSKLLFVLDRTKKMEEELRWTLIRRAMTRVIMSLVEGLEIAVVSYGTDATISLPFTVVTSQNREGLIGRIPRRASQAEDFSLESALSAAEKLLQQDGTNPGRIILITGSPESEISPDTFPEASVVVFPSIDASLALMHSFHTRSVPENGRNHSVTQQRLSEALLNAVKEVGGVSLYQIFEQTHLSLDGSSVSGSYFVPNNLGNNTIILVHAADEGDVESFEVKSPSGELLEFPTVGDGLLFFKINGVAEAGDWLYTVNFSSERPTSAVVVEVLTEPRDLVPDRLEAEVWTSSPRGPIAPQTTPLVLYAKVMKGKRPVWNASVTAIVSRPGQASVEVNLKDSGFGDPDVTKGDGIYSGYFTQFSAKPGFYSVRLVVGNQNLTALEAHPAGDNDQVCCGSVMPHRQLVRMERFHLTGITTTFATLQGVEKNRDIYPPSRITDFRVKEVNNASSEVELVWSAPGGEYDHGKANRYEIRCYTDRESLSDSNFASKGILVHASSTPEPADFGIQQHSVAQVPWPNEVFYYAIVAIDTSGNRAKVSNIVPVFIYEAPPPPPTTTTLPQAESEESEEVWLVSSTSIAHEKEVRHLELQDGMKGNEFYALIGGVAGGFVLLLLVFLAALMCRRRASKSVVKDEEKPKENALKSEQDVERPIYQIYVNNAYIQEENGELKIITPDGKVQQNMPPSWYATMPRNKRAVPEEPVSTYTSSLPRSKNTFRQNKVLTNGSIMATHGATIIGIVGDGTSISSKPSVASDDTGIESCEERISEPISEGVSYGYDRGIKLDPTKLAVTHDLSCSSDSVRNLSPLDLASNQIGIPTSGFEMTHSLPNPKKNLNNSFLSFRVTRLDSEPDAHSSPMNKARSSMHVHKKKRHISFV